MFLFVYPLWPPCVADADIIFLPCGFFLSSIFYLFYPSPNLSGRRLDVYHAGLKCAARWKYRTQKWCKKSQSAHHRTTLSSYIFATKARIDNWKKNVFSQYGERRPTSGWDRFVSLWHTSKFRRVSRLGSVTAQPNCSVEQRAPPLFGRAAITLGIGPHFCSSSLFCVHFTIVFRCTCERSDGFDLVRTGVSSLRGNISHWDRWREKAERRRDGATETANNSAEEQQRFWRHGKVLIFNFRCYYGRPMK